MAAAGCSCPVIRVTRFLERSRIRLLGKSIWAYLGDKDECIWDSMDAGRSHSEPPVGKLRPGALPAQCGAVSPAVPASCLRKAALSAFLEKRQVRGVGLEPRKRGSRERWGHGPNPADREPGGQEMALSVTASPVGQGTKTHLQRPSD